MAINGDYAHPVTVNGYSCKNCTDVDYAKKYVDPAHPKDGPYGVNATEQSEKSGNRGAAVRLGGNLTDLDVAGASQAASASAATFVDIRV
jgi:hypothetical protein